MKNLKTLNTSPHSWIKHIATGAIFCSLVLNEQICLADKSSHMRDKRYCEILLSSGMSYKVYNTWGLNNCPNDIWRQITSAGVKKETHSLIAHLNGPRFWTFDGFKDTVLINSTVRTIQGLQLREAGDVHLNLWSIIQGKPYNKITVDRKTTWIYQAHKPVYELIDPEGRVFVMQSYSTQKIPQTLESLSKLGSILKLPQGWKFKTGLTQKTQFIKAVNNKAVVVQDDLLNTYQYENHDLL